MEALIGEGVWRYQVTFVYGTDRHLPDLLAPDPPEWRWPFACHRLGHVWVVGKMFCGECGASYRAHGPDQGEWKQRSYRAGYEWGGDDEDFPTLVRVS